MTMFFEDAVTATNLAVPEPCGVYYIDGHFANEQAVRDRLGPGSKLFGITVLGRTGHDVFACDCERGDLTVQGAINWVAEQVKLGVALICVYASLDTWEHQGLRAALAHYGPRIRRWQAHFDGVVDVPPGYDAKQYEGDVKPGVDKNIANDDFFATTAPKPVAHSGMPKPRKHPIKAGAKRVVGKVKAIHPKVAAASGGAAITGLVTELLTRTFHVHLTADEIKGITVAVVAILGYLTPAAKQPAS